MVKMLLIKRAKAEAVGAIEAVERTKGSRMRQISKLDHHLRCRKRKSQKTTEVKVAEEEREGEGEVADKEIKLVKLRMNTMIIQLQENKLQPCKRNLMKKKQRS